MKSRNPLIHRGCHIVLSMDESKHLRYHVSGPFTPGYDSLEAAYAAIDSQLDN